MGIGKTGRVVGTSHTGTDKQGGLWVSDKRVSCRYRTNSVGCELYRAEFSWSYNYKCRLHCCVEGGDH